MKATGLKHLLRSIRKSGVSFLAVAVIAGVSIAIFQGFQSSAHASSAGLTHISLKTGLNP